LYIKRWLGSAGGSPYTTNSNSKGRGITPFDEQEVMDPPIIDTTLVMEVSNSSLSFCNSPSDAIYFLCGGPHLHKNCQGNAKCLVFQSGKWIDKMLSFGNG
jgi:hypothetical protein